MVSLKHLFHSGKADEADTGFVRPSNWNAEHKFETSTDGVMLGRAVGSGPGAVEELPITNIFLVGMIIAFGGGNAPAGWLMCDGTVRTVTDDDEALVSVIGNKFGGDGVTTFGVPDLRGRTMAGRDGGTGRLPGGANVGAGLGNKTAETGTFASTGVNPIDLGDQEFKFDSGTAHVSENSVTGLTSGGGNTATQTGDDVIIDEVEGKTRVKGDQSITVSGGSDPFSIIQPTMVVNFLIKR